MNEADYRRIIDLAIEEDFGKEGDITSTAIFTSEKGHAVLLSGDEGILAGSFLFTGVFQRIDPAIHITFYYSDGEALSPLDRVATVEGLVQSILRGERIAINFLSLLSGIATQTSRFVKAAASGNTLILDTRKTIPGYRALSKYAVRVGGGGNHRMGLYDMILIKDNHIDAAGSITEAVRRVRDKWGDRYTIEAECRTLDDVREALSCDVHIIMLDNMDSTTIKRAVDIIGGRAKCEASGNMDEERIKEVCRLGVDCISVGMITKSIKAFDFSLDIAF